MQRNDGKAVQALQEAMMRHQMGDLVEAARLYKLVLRKQPRQFDALQLLGMLEGQRGRFQKAEKLITEALAIQPNAAEVISNLANVQHQLGKLQDALASYDRALSLKPDYALGLNNRGHVLLALGRLQESVESFDAALAADASFAGALHNRGIALRALGEHEQALASFDRALALDASAPSLHADRAATLVALGRSAQALDAFDRAIALDPQLPDTHYNRAVALIQLGRFAEALESLDKAIALQPRFAPALGNRGNVLLQLGRLDEALASFDRALAADPGFLVALADRGHAAMVSARYDIAAEAFDRLVTRDAQFPYALGNLLYARMHCCDWDSFKPLQSVVQDGVRAGRRTAFPGHMLAFSNDPEDHLLAARTWVADAYPAASATRTPRRYAHDRIRVAYVSANLHEHAMPTLLAGMWEHHDRGRFETFAFSLGTDDGSAMRTRLTKAFDEFHDVRLMSDAQIAAMMEQREIDLAIDLMGFTQAARTGIFMLRPANIQVSYMGFAGTTGLPCLDYIVADKTVIPDERRSCFSENVVQLPDSYYVNDDTRVIAPSTITRAEAGLPAQGFVFCCFNNNYKITPDIFDIWMRLLRAVEGSVLWLIKPNAVAQANLRKEAQARGVEPSRLVFADRLAPDAHLARHRLADLFVDTLPYNAHTTACDALWTGLPVVTLMGETFPARVAASVLRAVGLPDMVTTTADDYEALALRLATEPHALTQARESLARNRTTQPLFDTKRFTRHMEQAYVTMWERHQRGEAPAGFAVAPLP
ncbi:MAG: tetratricopeptide repeat protein [Variibacter sp.]|nr:tetratricopeptide repeat protein [Variibacter sp.]